MFRKNSNGYIRDSLDLYKSEKATDDSTSSKNEQIFRGFLKVPVVLCERYDIKPFLKMPPVVKKPTFVAVDQVPYFSKRCSVKLERENLALLKEVFMKRNRVSNASYTCNICQKVYLSEKKLLNHQENKHVILCYKPENKIRKKVSFSDEIIVHEVKEYHRCRKCPKIYEDYDSLKAHMKEIHKKRRCYICFYCSKDFIDRMFFKVHIKLHCDSCGLLLPNKRLYMEHRRYTCKTVKKYVCKTCQISLYHFLDLKDHSYEHLGNFYICDICKDRFDDKCALSHHIKFLHAKRRPKSLYKIHLVSTDMVYSCNFCELSTIERVLMEKHVSTFPEYEKCAMTGYNDFYFCDQCFEKFSTETDMLQHKWSHFLKTSTEKNVQDSPKPITLFNMEGFNNCTTQKPLNNNTDNMEGAKQYPFKKYYNINEKLPAFLQPKIVLEKIVLSNKKNRIDTPINFSDVTNLYKYGLKKPIKETEKKRKKNLTSKHQCKLCFKFLSSNYCLSRHMHSVHGISKDSNNSFRNIKKGDLHCHTCEEDFALPSLLLNHNCIRSNLSVPTSDLNFTGMEVLSDFDDININDNEDYMNSVDFDIPAPIVEFTEYENVTLIINGGIGNNSNVEVNVNNNQINNVAVNGYNGQLNNAAVDVNDRRLNDVVVNDNNRQCFNMQLNNGAVDDRQLNNIEDNDNEGQGLNMLFNNRVNERQLNNVSVDVNDRQLNNVAVNGNNRQCFNMQLNNGAVDNRQLNNNVEVNDNEGQGLNMLFNNGVNDGQLNNIADIGNDRQAFNMQLNNCAVDVNDRQDSTILLNTAFNVNFNSQLNNDVSNVPCFNRQLKVDGKQSFLNNIRYVVMEVPIEF